MRIEYSIFLDDDLITTCVYSPEMFALWREDVERRYPRWIYRHVITEYKL